MVVWQGWPAGGRGEAGNPQLSRKPQAEYVAVKKATEVPSSERPASSLPETARGRQTG